MTRWDSGILDDETRFNELFPNRTPGEHSLFRALLSGARNEPALLPNPEPSEPDKARRWSPSTFVFDKGGRERVVRSEFVRHLLLSHPEIHQAKAVHIWNFLFVGV